MQKNLHINLLILLTLLLTGTITGLAQTQPTKPDVERFPKVQSVDSPTPTPTPPTDRDAPVITNQGFIDDATKAFDTVVAQRDALAKYAAQTKLTDIERGNVDAVLKSFDALIAIKDKTISAEERLNALYAQMQVVLQQMIEFQNKIIGMLQDKLLKPKSFWQKFLNGVKEVIKAVLYIGIGRAVSLTDFKNQGFDLTIYDYG